MYVLVGGFLPAQLLLLGRSYSWTTLAEAIGRTHTVDGYLCITVKGLWAIFFILKYPKLPDWAP